MWAAAAVLLCVLGAHLLCGRAVGGRFAEFVGQRVADKGTGGGTDQALQKPAAGGLIVHILLAVGTGNGFALLALRLRFGRQGFVNRIGIQLINGVVFLAALRGLQLGDLFLLSFELLLKLGLFVVAASG